MAGLKYDKIVRYDLTVSCEGPLRIGSGGGDQESVLVHPVDGNPFMQASSIVGALRSYGSQLGLSETAISDIFGTTAEDGTDSRIKVSDGIFRKPVRMELRPHVRIDRHTGSATTVEVKGTNKKSGQKFNTEYIGAGQICDITVLVYDRSDKSITDDVETILGGLGAGYVHLGGKKSSGAGIVKLDLAKKKRYNLRDKADLRAWIDNDFTGGEDYTAQLKKSDREGMAYILTITGKTEGGIQVKGLSESKFGEDASDSSNIRNVKGEYIVPGSSFKGTVRSQMEKIAGYIGRDDLIEDIFGQADVINDTGHAGNIYFRDAVIGDAAVIANIGLKHRLHIDKFTGGVINPFAERNAAGEIEFIVEISRFNHPQHTLGLLLLALRDLAIGTMSVGNGYANGKGFIDVSQISVKEVATKKTSLIKYGDKKELVDESGIITAALQALEMR